VQSNLNFVKGVPMLHENFMIILRTVAEKK